MKQPSATMLAMDWNWYAAYEGRLIYGYIRSHRSRGHRCCDPNGTNLQGAIDRHGGKGSNILWGDLHVAWLNAFEWNEALAYANSSNPDPNNTRSDRYGSGHPATYFYFPLGVIM
ncbi:MAG: hypothetical protein J7M14_06075 [Planctomycetes bacterium]|nr:hypothetical protein [Planctomycetota bacterium]